MISRSLSFARSLPEVWPKKCSVQNGRPIRQLEQTRTTVLSPICLFSPFGSIRPLASYSPLCSPSPKLKLSSILSQTLNAKTALPATKLPPLGPSLWPSLKKKVFLLSRPIFRRILRKIWQKIAHRQGEAPILRHSSTNCSSELCQIERTTLFPTCELPFLTASGPND